MADIRYSVEVAYVTKGKVKNPLDAAGAGGSKSSAKSIADYDRNIARSIKDMSRLKAKADREDRTRSRAAAKEESTRRGAWDQYRATNRRNTERKGNYAIDGMTGVGQGIAAGFGSAVDTMGGMLISGLTAAAVAAGSLIASGISVALKTGIDFADTIERAEISLAAMAKMQLGGSWKLNKARSVSVIESARSDAAELPGEMSDILGAMKTLGTPGMQSGMSLMQVEKMSASLVAMAEIEGMSTKVASTQAARILQGRMTGNNNFGLRLGITDFKKVNKMDPKERAEMLGKLMHEGAAPALADFKASWRGLTSNISDNWKNVARSFAQPMIDHLKAGMTKGLSWFGQNEHEIHQFAKNLGVDVMWAFKWGEQVIQRWYGPVLAFGQHLREAVTSGLGTMGPLIESMSHKLIGFLENPKSIDRLLEAAKLLAGAKVGSMGLSAGAGMAGALAPFAKMLGVGAEGGAMSLAAVGEASLIAAPLIIALGLGVVGLVHILSDGGNKWNETVMKSISSMEKLVMGTDKTTSKFEEMWVASQPIVDLFGVALIKALEMTIVQLSGFAQAISALIAMIPGQRVVAGFKDDPMGPDPTADPRRKWAWWTGLKMDQNPNRKETEADRKARIPNHTTNIHNVEIKVMSNQDPNRVAKSTAQALLDIARHPKVSRSAVSNVSVR